MIFPRATRSRPAAGNELIDAATVCVHNGTGRSARAEIQRVGDSITIRVGLAQERKGRVEGACTDDVSPDAQPVRSKILISDPALQIPDKVWRRSRLWSRKPQKIAAAQQHFGPEEI